MEERKGISERFFAFVENGIFLSVFSVVAGLVGVFVFGPILTICTIFVVLALRRSKAISDLLGWYQAVIYLWVVLIFGGIFYCIGTLIENHRDHIPTVAEIVKGINEQPGGKQGHPGTGTAPPPPKKEGDVVPPKKKVTPQPPQPPIILKASPVEVRRGQGGYAQVTLKMQNVSGKVIKVVSKKISTIAATRKDSAGQIEVEDAVWNQVLLSGLASNPDYDEISTADDGHFYRVMRFKPFTEESDQLLSSGNYAVYFMVVIKDSKTKESLFEFCGWIDENLGVRACHKHNNP